MLWVSRDILVFTVSREQGGHLSAIGHNTMNANAGTLGVHDAGGATDFGAGLSLEGALDKAKQALLREIEVCAIAVLMSKKGLRVVDESRRHLELLPPARYGTISYWAKWACGTAQLSMAADIFTQAELDEELRW